jgi:hypothetical protein
MDRHLAELEYGSSLISLKQKCLHPSFLAMPHLDEEGEYNYNLQF